MKIIEQFKALPLSQKICLIIYLPFVLVLFGIGSIVFLVFWIAPIKATEAFYKVVFKRDLDISKPDSSPFG